MLKIDSIPRHIVCDIASNMGWDDGDELEPYRQLIAKLSASQAFDYWCKWHGFFDWSRLFEKTLDTLRAAEEARCTNDVLS